MVPRRRTVVLLQSAVRLSTGFSVTGVPLMIRKVLLCTAAGALATAIACGKSSPPPTSPSSAVQPEAGAAADGSTLKATTPSAVSPTGGTQPPDPLTLTASKSNGKFQPLALSYQFQVRSGSTVVYDSGATGAVSSGDNVTHQVPDPRSTPRRTTPGGYGPFSRGRSRRGRRTQPSRVPWARSSAATRSGPADDRTDGRRNPRTHAVHSRCRSEAARA